MKPSACIRASTVSRRALVTSRIGSSLLLGSNRLGFCTIPASIADSASDSLATGLEK